MTKTSNHIRITKRNRSVNSPISTIVPSPDPESEILRFPLNRKQSSRVEEIFREGLASCHASATPTKCAACSMNNYRFCDFGEDE